MSQPVQMAGPPLSDQRFTTTHWSVVQAARGSSADGSAALETLCRTYWGALYAYIRRQGRSPADAADLTQAFFARFLEREFLKDADPARGRFRSFLLKTLNHFLADEWRFAQAQKRGGRCAFLSIDADDWESRHGHEVASDQTPEALFERRWALALFDQALARLREEFIQSGKARQFDRLKEFLSSAPDNGAYADAAAELGLSPGTVAVQVHRLRRRYGELVREEVAHTVSDRQDVEAELRHLAGVMAG